VETGTRPAPARIRERTDREGFAAPARLTGKQLLARYALQRDRPTRDAIVAEFMPLAHKLARRYLRSSEPMEDLAQVASLGLVKAVERYDPERGASFASFAIPTILGELRRYFRDATWAVHVPRAAQERIQAIEAATGRMTAANGRPPTVEQLAFVLEIDTEMVVDALLAKRAYEAQSLDAPRRGAPDDDPGLAVIDTAGYEDEGFALAEKQAAVAPALRELSDRDRLILKLRFEGELTQSQIAARIGVSQMQVSRLLARAIASVRERAGVQDDDQQRPARREP
jgi:RNA polymerase sigma-B factor